MDIFKAHLDKFITVSDDEFTSIISFFQILETEKKENIMLEGEICKFKYFVLEGCLRKFFVNEKGVEQTTEFAIENWWLADTFAYERQEKSNFNIQSVERSRLLIIDLHSQELLLEKHPIMERYFRMIYQRAYAAAEKRIRYIYEMTKEEYYVHFSTLYPWFIQRIPQYLIASFLGFTPEYLSEIRAKLRS
ncbi:CRP-like cAMP-binding protein [Chryseobacterium sp. H1D6B]|uniref:Crp/Fnr family transcriptional regulator n=1 Tax=Chryseobacterium sp. H1D6B TaxID=2940588 RepID=UPI0015CC6C0A|nr:Crp/Fnr family transcriptional regulator [Chryseobacterium sp. H1D6B]MDH6252737.1 CRP-like cAMP-binding protein [Chryseobacterium sp. H1D6B]